VASTATPAVRKSPIQAKHLMFVVYGLLIIVVYLTRDRLLLDANSWLRQRYAPISGLMLLHGIPGVLALILGVFQFSSRLRQRYLQLHRVMGRIYVGCVAIAAPVSVVVAYKLPIPALSTASVIQASGWILCTATAIYCVRTGRIQQHREWMMRATRSPRSLLWYALFSRFLPLLAPVFQASRRPCGACLRLPVSCRHS
jgi:uncharacterized membrane protein